MIDRPDTNARAGEAAGRDLAVSRRPRGGSAGGAKRAFLTLWYLLVPAALLNVPLPVPRR